ncbi:MAG TPA: OST-HTH/LOTUS domain-containing protein, partial [Burkholderiaceae bacterium]|nr:OST-HTH/LOTUS domain-containing protein [Burkholderiaceae bacterium]
DPAEAYDGADGDGVSSAGQAGKRQEAIDLVMETIEALVNERGSDDRIYGSMVKQALKRRRPDFNEGAYGYKVFGKLLEDAQARGLLRLTRDEKTGQNTVRLPGTDT